MNKIQFRDTTVMSVTSPIASSNKNFTNNLVVTYSKDGSPLSRFKDDAWDYSATSASMKAMNFSTKLSSITPASGCEEVQRDGIEDAKDFLKTFALNWIFLLGGCSMSKLNGDLVAVSYLIRYCSDKKISLDNIFSTPEALDFMIERVSTEKQLGSFLGKIQRISKAGLVLNEDPFWKALTPSDKFESKLKRARKKYPETTPGVKTLVIPSRIYQHLLKNLFEEIDLFLKHEKTIKFVFSMRALAISNSQNIRTGRNIIPGQLSKGVLADDNLKQWKKVLESDERLSTALNKLSKAGISKDASWAGFRDTLKKWQCKCAILIGAFTGMRISELMAIPVNGLQTLKTINGDIPVIWSTTTKLEVNGAPCFTKWVTGSKAEDAFHVARIISEGALSCTCASFISGLEEKDIPLFLSVDFAAAVKPHPRFSLAVTAMSTLDITAFLSNKEFQVSELDMAEISWFLYGEEVPSGVKLGEVWPLQFHQLRRSMAVYAAASGMVSYQALKAQLKHISMLMTLYYTDANSRALNILGDEDEVKAMRKEWADAKAYVEAEDIHKLLRSDQPLAGSAGKKLRSQQNRGELPTFLESRKMTKQAVKNGKIRYRPTLVGGCMSVSPCNKGAGVLASACVSCESSVFLPGSRVALEQTKAFYEDQLAEGGPVRACKEYEDNIQKVNSFLNNIIEISDVA
jgi:integrase